LLANYLVRVRLCFSWCW